MSAQVASTAQVVSSPAPPVLVTILALGAGLLPLWVDLLVSRGPDAPLTSGYPTSTVGWVFLTVARCAFGAALVGIGLAARRLRSRELRIWLNHCLFWLAFGFLFSSDPPRLSATWLGVAKEVAIALLLGTLSGGVVALVRWWFGHTEGPSEDRAG